MFSSNDILVALSLQLEDLELVGKQDKGKYVSGKPSAHIIAINEYRAEIDRHKQVLEDLKLAQSIAQAVYTDAPLLSELTRQDIQAYEDRNYALQLSSNDPGCQNPPRGIHDQTESVKEWMSTVSEAFQAPSLADIESSDDEVDEAGPSVKYSERQAKTFDKLSEQGKCSMCLEHHHVAGMLKLSCEDRFCAACAKKFFFEIYQG